MLLCLEAALNELRCGHVKRLLHLVAQVIDLNQHAGLALHAKRSRQRRPDSRVGVDLGEARIFARERGRNVMTRRPPQEAELVGQFGKKTKQFYGTLIVPLTL
jgi:hypothetical protein